MLKNLEHTLHKCQNFLIKQENGIKSKQVQPDTQPNHAEELLVILAGRSLHLALVAQIQGLSSSRLTLDSDAKPGTNQPGLAPGVVQHMQPLS